MGPKTNKDMQNAPIVFDKKVKLSNLQQVMVNRLNSGDLIYSLESRAGTDFYYVSDNTKCFWKTYHSVMAMIFGFPLTNGVTAKYYIGRR